MLVSEVVFNSQKFMSVNARNNSPISLGGQPRDEVICINERLRCVRLRLEESYKTAKSSLIRLQTQYNESKLQSAVRRYALLKAMIKVIHVLFVGSFCHRNAWGV